MERKNGEDKLSQLLGDKPVTDVVRTALLALINKSEIGHLVVVEPHLAIALTERQDWDSAGRFRSTSGIGYWDQVHVFYNSQSKMQEWQWRDKYDSGKDRPKLSVHSIGEVKIAKENPDGMTLEVELVNEKYGNRTTRYVFGKHELG